MNNIKVSKYPVVEWWLVTIGTGGVTAPAGQARDICNLVVIIFKPIPTVVPLQAARDFVTTAKQCTKYQHILRLRQRKKY